MSYNTTLIFTESLLRKAVFAFWRRSVGVGFIVVLIALTAYLGLLLAQGNSSWVVGALTTLVFFGVTFAGAIYFVQNRATLRKFHAMGNLHATFLANNSSFSIISDIGTVTYEWSVVKQLWRFPDVWLMLYSPAQFSTLPLASLSPEMQSFIMQRVQAAGGKIAG